MIPILPPWPLLEVAEGRYLAESNAILWYVCGGTSLAPESRVERAEVLQWMFFEQYNHEPNVATLRFWLAFVGEASLNEAQRGQIAAKRTAGDAALRLMDDHLARDEAVVGEEVDAGALLLQPGDRLRDRRFVTERGQGRIEMRRLRRAVRAARS